MLTSIASPMLLGALIAVLLVTPSGFRIAWQLLGRKASLPLCLALCALLLARPMSPPLLFDLSLAALVAASALRSHSWLARCLAWSPAAHIGTRELLHVSGPRPAHRSRQTSRPLAWHTTPRPVPPRARRERRHRDPQPTTLRSAVHTSPGALFTRVTPPLARRSASAARPADKVRRARTAPSSHDGCRRRCGAAGASAGVVVVRDDSSEGADWPTSTCRMDKRSSSAKWPLPTRYALLPQL